MAQKANLTPVDKYESDRREAERLDLEKHARLEAGLIDPVSTIQPGRALARPQGLVLDGSEHAARLRRVGADLLSVGGKPRQTVRAKEHAHGAIGIRVNADHGLDEVGPEPALGQLQPPTAPCDRVVVADGS